MAEKQRIIVSVSGGLIDDIQIPKDIDVIVEVRDRDIEGSDEDTPLYKDDDGEYMRSEWENE